ncbi:MAG: Rrf2 family transcriptional regulator, partial [bacterium]
MMPISTKGRFASRIVVFLAGQGSAKPVTKYEIARGEEISADYVQQIMMNLKVAGLVASHRGR